MSYAFGVLGPQISSQFRAPASSPWEAALSPTVERQEIAASDLMGDAIGPMVVLGMGGGVLNGALIHHLAPGGSLGGRIAMGVAAGALTGLAEGALMGLGVAATGPREGDDLEREFAIAGGVVGGAAGLIRSGPGGLRILGAGLGTLGGAIAGGWVGRRSTREHAPEPAPTILTRGFLPGVLPGAHPPPALLGPPLLGPPPGVWG